MSEFYAYDNRDRRRSTVHRGECPQCDNGREVQGGSGAANGHWCGPFDSAQAAYAWVSGRGGVGYCAFCRPQDQETPTRVLDALNDRTRAFIDTIRRREDGDI